MQGRNGWTLPELLIVVTIIAVLAAAVVPAFQQVIEREHRVVVANQLAGGLLAAREDAIARGIPVTFCAGTPDSGCADEWSDGHWIVFTDRDHDAEIDDNDLILRTGKATLSTRVEIDGNGPFRTAVIFEPIGNPERISGAFAAGRLRVCTQGGHDPNTTDVVMAATGRLRSEHHGFEGRCPPL